MQSQVGYNLVEVSTGNIVEHWGGIWGQCPGEPNPVTLPNGDIVYGMKQGDTASGYLLEPWMMDQPSPTADDVIIERSRRLAVGFDYNFGDAQNPDIQHVGTTPSDMNGWNEVTAWANSQVALNNTTATVDILTDNGTATVTAIEWMKVVNASTEFRQPIWAFSFALQAMNPIPYDYTNDKYWTVSFPPIVEPDPIT